MGSEDRPATGGRLGSLEFSGRSSKSGVPGLDSFSLSPPDSKELFRSGIPRLLCGSLSSNVDDDDKLAVADVFLRLCMVA